jgi:hypothetical protein
MARPPREAVPLRLAPDLKQYAEARAREAQPKKLSLNEWIVRLIKEDKRAYDAEAVREQDIAELERQLREEDDAFAAQAAKLMRWKDKPTGADRRVLDERIEALLSTARVSTMRPQTPIELLCRQHLARCDALEDEIRRARGWDSGLEYLAANYEPDSGDDEEDYPDDEDADDGDDAPGDDGDNPDNSESDSILDEGDENEEGDDDDDKGKA